MPATTPANDGDLHTRYAEQRTGRQLQSHVTLHDGATSWVAWADAVPVHHATSTRPTYDANGVAQWIQDGALVMEPNSNGNTPRFMAARRHGDPDHHQPMGRLRAQRVLPDASTLGGYGAFCVYQKMPAGTAFSLQTMAKAVWPRVVQLAGQRIYAARLDRNGRLGDFTSVEERRASVQLVPEPAEGVITLQNLGGNALGELRIPCRRGARGARPGPHGDGPHRDRCAGPATGLVRGGERRTAGPRIAALREAVSATEIQLNHGCTRMNTDE